MARVSLHGSPEKPLCEAVKLKSGFPCRPQEIRDTRVVGYMSRRAANRDQNMPKGKKCVTVDSAERNWRSEERFDTRHEMQSLAFVQLVS